VMINKSKITLFGYQDSRLTAKLTMVLDNYMTYKYMCHFIWLCKLCRTLEEERSLRDFGSLYSCINFLKWVHVACTFQ
jgi:hypothetical protein